MPIEFRFLRLSVSGFRGVQDFSLDLPEKMPIHLIGANNAGKSTVLNAVAFVLKGGGFHQHTAGEYDFFHHADGKIEQRFKIELHFEASKETYLPAIRGIEAPSPVHGVRVVGETAKSGQLSHKHELFGADGQTIYYSPRTPLSKKAKEDYKDHKINYEKRRGRPEDIAEHLPEVWLLSADNLDASLYRWKTGPLQRLSRHLASQFMNTAWDFKFNDKSLPMPENIEKVHKFFRQAVCEFPYWKKELRPLFESALSQYLGRHTIMDLQPQVQDVEDWLAQQLVISMASDAGGSITPLAHMGKGWQSLVRLAALDVLSQIPDETKERIAVLLEEPETFLHPHLCRKMRGVLERLAERDWIVMTTTHAPDLISFASTQQVARLWREGGTVEKGVLLTTDAGPHVVWQERLEERGGQEMLFCNRAVLCEGKDDLYAVRLYLKKRDLDLDGRSVSIIRCGDVGQVPTYAEIAKKLGIPWFALTDEDLQADGSIKPNTAKARGRLNDLLSTKDQSLYWKGSLETCLKVLAPQKATPEWVSANVEKKDLKSIEREYPGFAEIGNAIFDWITAPAPLPVVADKMPGSLRSPGAEN